MVTRDALPPEVITAGHVAQLFHEAYERLAPQFSYQTRKASAVPWDEVPEPNRSLMIAVAAEVMPHLAAAEREACAQLADDLGATYPVTCTMADCPCLPGESAHTRPFADLLRKDPR